MSKDFQESVSVKGMHCKSCAELIETKLKAIKGIKKANVSYVDEKASVVFDPSQTNFNAIKREIESMGYETGDALAVDNKISAPEKKNRGIAQGIKYGLVPHIGCIAFILASVFGVTAATQLFEPLMLNPYFFYMLIALSFVFSTVSAFVYLRKQGFIEFNRNGSEIGISVADGTFKRKWKYLSTMYGTTIGINLLLFLVIFPLLANVSMASSTSGIDGLSTLKLQVDIPCSGHATLISGDIKKLDGILGIQFSLPNVFEVSFDPAKVTKQHILDLEVFKTYKAAVLSEASGINQVNVASTDGSVGTTATPSGNAIAITDGVQVVQLSVQGSNYYPNPIRVKRGIPVKIVADIGKMPGCSKSIVIPEFGVSKYLISGDNTIQFTPDKSGTFKFSCSMGMYQGQIIVEEADGSVASYTGSAAVPSTGACGGSGGGCSCGGK
jgi:copper chaperone CopZ